MNALADFQPQLLAITLVFLGALLAGQIAGWRGIPAPAVFLGAGALAGVLGFGGLERLPELELQQVGGLALFAILFNGGLETGAGPFRRSFREIAPLALGGTVASAAGLAVIGHLVGLPWDLAVLIGIALAPTDPAAVYSALRGGGETRARTVLEGESGFNDPIGISLMVVAVSAVGGGGEWSDGIGRLIQELGLGLALGIGGGLLLRFALPALSRVDESLRPVALVLAAVALGASTAALHGSGFLAVYLAGLVLADAWTRLGEEHDRVVPSLAAGGELLMFALLGAVAAPHLSWRDSAIGATIAVAYAIAIRPPIVAICLVGSDLERAERVLVSWGGLKGAVPLLLSALPALEGVDGADRVQAIVLAATAASLLVQGLTLAAVADRAATAANTSPPEHHSTGAPSA